MASSPSPKPNESDVLRCGARVVREEAGPPPHVHPPQSCYGGRVGGHGSHPPQRGRGTIIEENTVRNCKRGFYFERTPAIDVAIRDNQFYNVLEGISVKMDVSDTWTVGRLIAQTNLIELTEQSSVNPIGISLDGDASSLRFFKQAIIRRNQIRHKDGAAGSATAKGIFLDSVEAGIEEENLVNVGSTPDNPDLSKAITRTATYVSVKTFNNQSTAGKFLQSTYGTPTRQDPDLVTDAQDWMLGI